MPSAIFAVSILTLVVCGPLPLAITVALPAHQPSGNGVTSLFLLTVSVLWIACQMATATLLAAVNTFHLFPVIVVEALWLLGGAWFLRRRLIAGAVCWWPRGAGPTRAVLPGLAVAYLVLLLVGNLLSQPPTDYDSLYYHLPSAVNLAITGGLHPDGAPAAVSWYPFGWEALSALFLLPPVGALFVLLPNLLAWALYGIALYTAARRLRVTAAAAMWTTLLLLSQPLLIDQVTALRVDLALAALCGAGLIFALEGHRRSILLLGLVVLLLPAVKISGLIYGALLVTLWGGRWLWTRYRAQSPQQEAATAPLVWWLLLGLILLTGVATGYWYLRNWQQLGNPLGAVAVHLGPWQLFPGAITSATVRASTLWALFDPTRLVHWQLLLAGWWTKAHWPGLLLLLLAGVGFFVRARRVLRLSIWLGVGLLATVYWSTPYSGDDGTFGYQLTALWVGQSLRFALPALAALALAAALTVDWLFDTYPRGARWLGAVAVLAVAVSLAQRSALYFAAAAGLLVILAVLFLLSSVRHSKLHDLVAHPQRYTSRLIGGSAIALGFVGAVLLLPAVSARYSARAHAVYGAGPQLIDQYSAPGAGVAVIASHQGYLAHGATVQHPVYFLDTATLPAAQLLPWLAEHQISLIVVGPLRPEWQDDPLVQAVLDPAQPFELLWDGFPTHPRLYRLSKSS
jgi:hypothetical protein